MGDEAKKSEPLFSFGVIADVQYADKQDGGKLSSYEHLNLGFLSLTLAYSSSQTFRTLTLLI